MNPAALTQVSINQLESKVKSKKELYQFLVHDCSAYLPPIQSTNVYFLKAIIRGQKEYIKRDKVMVAAVPQIEGLTVEDLLKLSKGNAIIQKHLPDQRDWLHVDRKWVCDIFFTLDKQNFQNTITAAVKKRRDRIDKSQNLIVEMRPEFAQALQSCLNYSSEHGRASSLIKGNSKRKRTRREIEEVKTEEQQLKADKHAFLKEFKKLKTESSGLDQMLMHDSQPQIMAHPPQGAKDSKQKGQPFNI